MNYDDTIAGMRIAPQDPSTGYLLVIRSRARQQWIAYPPRDGEVASTVLYRGEYYRVAKIQQMPEGDWTYWLKEWPLTERTMRTIDLRPEAMAMEQERQKELHQFRRSAAYALPMEIATGSLPRRIQERIAETRATNPERATILNVIPIVAIMGICAHIVYSAMYAAVARLPVTIVEWVCMPLAIYCALDAFIRTGTVVAADRPMGLLVLEFLDWLYVRFIRRGE